MSLSERVIVDGHGCHTGLHFGVKAKENQDKIPTFYWLTKLYIKQDLLLIRDLVRQQNFLNCYPCVLQQLKHVIKYCEKVYERTGKNLFWSIKNSGEILINQKLEISMRPVCLLMIILLYTLLYLII